MIRLPWWRHRCWRWLDDSLERAAGGARRDHQTQARRQDPDVIVELSDFQMDVRDGLQRERMMAMLSGLFGVPAALLAMVGL